LKWKIVLMIIAAALLLHVPYVGDFLRAANTMIHESGHAFASLATNGEVYSISLFANREGVTHAGTTSWYGSFITGLAGYLFSSLTCVFLAGLWRRSAYRLIVLTLLVFSLANMFFWVRNGYGLFWLFGFALLLLAALRMRGRGVLSGVTLVLILILLTESVRAGFDIFILGLTAPQAAGDASHLQQMTGISALFWGSLFFAISLLSASWALRMVWRKQS
jgi:hypothetical protein